jgi:site-specific DNA recombinase
MVRAMSTETPLRTAIYTRISEKDSKVDKVEVQEKRLLALAETKGLAVVGVYTDDGISGWSGKKRSDWNRLRSDIGLKRIDVVLVDRHDRLVRSTLETEVFKLLCKDNSVTWMFANGSTLDPAKTMDAAMATFGGLMAQMESDIKKERLRARYDDELAKGNSLWGTRPFGYTSARDGEVIPEEKELIKGAYDTILSHPAKGSTLYAVAKRWNIAGIKTTRGNEWTYQTVRQLLLRPRNAGLVVRDGVVQEGLKGKWDPLVTEKTLAAAKLLLSDPKRVTAQDKERTYLCSGLIKCGVCDGPMRSHTVKVRGVVIPHYRCAAKLRVSTDKTRHTAIRVDQLDPMVRHAIISAFLFGTDDMISQGQEVDTAPIHMELARVRAARKRIVTLAGMMDNKADEAKVLATAAKDLKGLANEERSLTQELLVAANASAHAAMTVDLREGVFTNGRVSLSEAKNARAQLSEKFDSLSLEKKRDLVETHLEIKINPGRKLQRIEIVHRVVLSLNDPEEVPVELDETKLGTTEESERLRLL